MIHVMFEILNYIITPAGLINCFCIVSGILGGMVIQDWCND